MISTKNNLSFTLFIILLYLLRFDKIQCIVNKNGSKNLTTITDNHIYKPPLEPMRSTSYEELLVTSNNDEQLKKRYNYTVNPSFVPMYCSSIPVISGATAYPNSGDKFLENTTISYSCNRGFKKISGHEKIKCVKSEQKINWEKPTLKCEIIKCNDPGFVDNSRREAFELTYNSTVSYKCHHGYKAEGIPSIVCTEKGIWNRSPPKCVPIQCPELVVNDANLIVDYTDKNRLVDSEAVPFCSNGYRMVGGSIDHIICQWSGQWSHKILPRCERIYCKPPNKTLSMQIIPKKKKNIQLATQFYFVA